MLQPHFLFKFLYLACIIDKIIIYVISTSCTKLQHYDTMEIKANVLENCIAYYRMYDTIIYFIHWLMKLSSTIYPAQFIQCWYDYYPITEILQFVLQLERTCRCVRYMPLFENGHGYSLKEWDIILFFILLFCMAEQLSNKLKIKQTF